MLDFPRDYHILVVDDASTDATAEVLAPYARVLPLTIFRNEQRLGYARSLERLLREAVRRSSYPKRDVVITLQADFTDEPAEIATLVKKIESGADVVSAASSPGRNAPRAVRWTRPVLAYLLRKLRWNAPVSDPLSGFRAYRVITLRKALQQRGGEPLLTREGWAANAELLRAVVPYSRRTLETRFEPRYDRLRRPPRFQPWQTLRQLLDFPRGPLPMASAAAEPVAVTESAGGEPGRNGQVARPRRPAGGRHRPPRSATGNRRRHEAGR